MALSKSEQIQAATDLKNKAKRHAETINAAKKKKPPPKNPASTAFLDAAESSAKTLQLLSTQFKKIEENEKTVQATFKAKSTAIPGGAALSSTSQCHKNIKHLLREIRDDIIIYVEEEKYKIRILLDTLRSKRIIYNNIE